VCHRKKCARRGRFDGPSFDTLPQTQTNLYTPESSSQIKPLANSKDATHGQRRSNDASTRDLATVQSQVPSNIGGYPVEFDVLHGPREGERLPPQ